MKGWIAVVVALAGFGLACLLSSLPPTSECSTPQRVLLLPALALLALYWAAGFYAVVKGSVAVRIALLAGTSLIMAIYLCVLAFTLPIAFETEIGCARHRPPVLRMDEDLLKVAPR